MIKLFQNRFYMSSIINLVNTNDSKNISILKEETLLHFSQYWNIALGAGSTTYIDDIFYSNSVFVGRNSSKTYYSKIINRSKLATQILQAQYPISSIITLQDKINSLSYLGFGKCETTSTEASYTYTRTA